MNCSECGTDKIEKGNSLCDSCNEWYEKNENEKAGKPGGGMNGEKIDAIRQAVRLVEEACELVDGAMEGSNDKNHYEAYGKYGFNQLLGDGNPYDNSLFTLIENLEGEDK